MRYAKIIYDDMINGEGIGVSLFVQGCSNHCEGCFNKDTWDFNGGKEFTIKELDSILNYVDTYKNHISHLSILGGEPLDNIQLTSWVVKSFKEKFPDKKVWLWTGYNYSDVIKNTNVQKLFKYVDVLIDGRFIQSQKNLNLKFRGSTNQRIIDVQASLKNNKVILFLELTINKNTY